MTDVSFKAMGCDIRLIGDGVDRARRWLEDYEACLSRFRPDSELSRLNADPRVTVPASPLLRHAIGAAQWAARRTGGLVDATLGAWRQVKVGERTITRPPGTRFDTGGTGKGLAADHLARMIGGTADCAGDVRVVGTQEVHVIHPLSGECCQVLRITDGAVATSGNDRRPGHLIDPRTGRPAATGIVTATALAPTALEAEALAKAALLTADPARLTHGGVLVRDDGDVEVVRP